MLNVLVVVLALVVAAIYVVYYNRIRQKEKASQAKTKKRLANVERIKGGFKADLERLTNLGVMSEQAQDRIYGLAIYYFIFQPATSENIEECEKTLKLLLMTIREKMQDAENNNPVFLRLQLDNFARSLPRKIDGYNPNFYQKKLPKLIQKLEEEQGAEVLTDY